MVVLKVIGCGLCVLVYLGLVIPYSLEWYAWQRKTDELSGRLKRCDTLEEELLRIREEIDEKASQEYELLPEDEFQDYCKRLSGSKKPCDEHLVFGLLWYQANRNARLRKLYPELYRRSSELEACLEDENERISQIRRELHYNRFYQRQRCS